MKEVKDIRFHFIHTCIHFISFYVILYQIDIFFIHEN